MYFYILIIILLIVFFCMPNGKPKKENSIFSIRRDILAKTDILSKYLIL